MAGAIFGFVVALLAFCGFIALIAKLLGAAGRAVTTTAVRQSDIAHGRTPATRAQVAEARFRAAHEDWPEDHLRAHLTLLDDDSDL